MSRSPRGRGVEAEVQEVLAAPQLRSLVVGLVIVAGVTACTVAQPSISIAPTDGAIPSGTSSAPGATTTPADVGPATPWARIADDAAIFGGAGQQFVNSVVAGGPWMLAVGGDASGADGDASVWMSPDGYEWEWLPDEDGVLGGEGNQMMNSVVLGGPGLVAVGWDDSGGDLDAAVWVSTDGYAWERIPHDEAIFGGPSAQRMMSVTAGGPGLVAVGSELPGGDWDAAVWASNDGYAWERVPHDEAIFGGSLIEEMLSVTTGGPGLVAVGGEYSAFAGYAAVWVSADGYVWERIQHDQAAFTRTRNQEMVSVTPGGPGLVAVGWADGGDRDAAAWVSADGYAWSRVGEAGFATAGDQSISAVAVGGSGIVGVGWDNADGDEDAAVWASSDGSGWSRVADHERALGGPEVQQMVSVAIGGPGLVAVGGEQATDDWDVVVWISPPAD